MTVIANGFIFSMAVLQVLFSAKRVVTKKGKFRDWFILCYAAVCSIYLAKWKLPLSTAPDFPIICLIGLTAWVVMILESAQHAEDKVGITSRASVIIAMLSLGALTIKLTAIPLVILATLYFLSKNRFRIGSLLTMLAIAGFFILPLLIVNIKVSGCPIYPSSVLCLDVPWLALKNVGGLGESWVSPTEFTKPLPWLYSWIVSEKFGAALLVISVAAIAYFTIFRRKVLLEQAYPILLGVFGMAFILGTSPSTRLGLGYFCLLPALLLADLFSTRYAFPTATDRKSKNNLLRLFKISSALFICIVIVVLFSRPSPFYVAGKMEENSPASTAILLPAKVTSPRVISHEANDFQYFSPEGGGSQCWAADLPCTPEILEGVQLRKPELSLAGGFINTP